MGPGKFFVGFRRPCTFEPWYFSSAPLIPPRLDRTVYQDGCADHSCLTHLETSRLGYLAYSLPLDCAFDDALCPLDSGPASCRICCRPNPDPSPNQHKLCAPPDYLCAHHDVVSNIYCCIRLPSTQNRAVGTPF